MPKEDLFTPIHKGIRSMIYDTGSLFQTTDFGDNDASDKAFARLDRDLRTAPSSCVLCFLSNHANDENNHIFSIMKSHVPELVTTLLREHEEIEKEMEGISNFSKDLRNIAIRQERIARGVVLNKKLNEFFAYYIAHMNREEETILPATQTYLTDEQQASIRAKITMSLPPDRAPVLLGWIAKSLNINEAETLLKALKGTLPPPAFDNILQVAQNALGPERWEQLRVRLGS
jgi:Hemerythrin HHE cation binding domain